MPSEIIGVIEFDGFVADGRRLEVRRAGQALDLEPKAVRVLFYLIAHRDRVVTKDELMAQVWSGAFVTDNALTRVIAQIRKQLGDNARAPRYIETANTAGYRFIADVKIQVTSEGLSLKTMVGRDFFLATLAAVVVLVGLALALKYLPLSRGRPVQLAGLRQITRAAAADLWPAFSPDGSQIAFSSNRSGVFEIYVQSLAAGSVERQVTKDGQENIQPVWSPDGRYLAFVARKRGGIAVIPVSGGVTRFVTTHGDSPAWSPDGKSLAFRASSMDMNPAFETTGRMETNIWIVGADGSQARPLTKLGSPIGGHNYPRWSPDGRYVIFSSGISPFAAGSKAQAGQASNRPWAVEVRTGRLHEIEIDARVVRSPVLSADGAHLYYTGAGGLEPGLWHARIRGFRAAAPQILVPAGGPTPRDLALSADGKRLAFSQQNGESAIWTLPLTPAAAAAGEPRPLIQDRSFRNAEPVFSADGTRLAYSSIRQGGEWGVFLADAGGSSPRLVTDPEQLSGRPAWRGPSATLGYRVIHGGEWSYWLLPPAGRPSRLQLKLDLERADRLRFSPDGTQVVAHIPTPVGTQVVVEDLATHAIRQLTPAGQDMGVPSWSPDGRWIAVHPRQGGTVRLAYVPAAGGAVRPLDTGAAQSLGHDWSPDSGKLTFAGLVDGVWNVFWISRTTGQVRQLTHFTSHSAFVRYPAWSPKGDQMVFEHNSFSANIYVAELR